MEVDRYAMDLIRDRLDGLRVAAAAGKTMATVGSRRGLEEALDTAGAHLSAARALLADVFNNTSNIPGETELFD